MSRLAAAVASLVILAVPLHAGARQRKLVRISADLTPTTVDADARGRAIAFVAKNRGRFIVKVKRLAGGASYEIVVQGVRVGVVATAPSGAGRARFSSRPRGTEQLLGFDPRGKTIVVRDGDGHDVLTGALPSLDPSLVRCCIGAQAAVCALLTEDQCLEQGDDMGPGSCLPDPCEPDDAPTPASVRCCVPSGAEPFCVEEPATECSADDGIDVGNGTCDPNPCVPAQPPPPDTQCCIAGAAPACSLQSPADCAVAGGRDAGAGSCSPDPCVTPPPDQPTVICCIPDVDGNACDDIFTASECTDEEGGISLGVGECGDVNPCPGAAPD